MLKTPEQIPELRKKLYQKAKQDCEFRWAGGCERRWKIMIGKPLSRERLNVPKAHKLNVRLCVQERQGV